MLVNMEDNYASVEDDNTLCMMEDSMCMGHWCIHG